MKPGRRVGRGAALVVGLGLFLTSCASNAPQDSLKPEGPLARKIDGLFFPVFWVAVAVFVLVQGLILFAVLRFRSKRDDDSIPAQMHGNTRLELGWTILPAVVLALVAVFTVPVIFQLADNPKGAMQVDVYGQKYFWSYEYSPQQAYGINSKIITANEMHIPAGTRVVMHLRSRDVIHSFWAPRLNGKRDVVPGHPSTWQLEADKPGVYSGQCAEFCGTSHANMRLKVVAHDQAGWQAWLADQTKPAVVPTSGLAAQGYTLFGQRCATCHIINGVYEQKKAGTPSAPNLTHLFSRDCFAGCIYDLTNRTELEAWLRNPQRKEGSLMVIGALTETDIDKLVAYLQTLK